MRALAQKYLFTYLMGHSPRYFQENFAGKLGGALEGQEQSVRGKLALPGRPRAATDLAQALQAGAHVRHELFHRCGSACGDLAFTRDPVRR